MLLLNWVDNQVDGKKVDNTRHWYFLIKSFPQNMEVISIEYNNAIMNSNTVSSIVKTQTNLQVLSLSYNSLDPNCGSVLLDLPKLKYLRVLKLCGNQLMDRGVKFLTNALSSHPTLTGLHLCNNFIRPDGGTSIATLLKKNNVLQQLSLNNEIKDSGLKAISAALQPNRSLVRLSISGNKITNKGIGYLVAAYKANIPTHIKINISKNDIKTDQIPQVFSMIFESTEENCSSHVLFQVDQIPENEQTLNQETLTNEEKKS